MEFVEDHREAIESDLLRETGYELNDVGRRLSWDALDSFVKNLRPDSATARELEPELSVWATQAKTNAILADIYDLLSGINANIIAMGSGKRAKQPKRYPRPGQKDKNVRQIGGGNSAMPVNQLKAWLEEKRKNDPRNKKEGDKK